MDDSADAIPAPFVGLRTEVKPEWIDYNGHFNAGYYFVVFDDAVTDVMAFVGLDEEHRRRHDVTTFSVEGHITFEREMNLGDPIEIRTVFLDWDAKKFHYINLMYHGTEGWLAATNELLFQQGHLLDVGGELRGGIDRCLGRLHRGPAAAQQHQQGLVVLLCGAAGAGAEVCTDPGEAIRDADMVVTSIPEQPGLQPFLDANTLSAGAFLAAVDLGRSWIPESFTAFDRIVLISRPET